MSPVIALLARLIEANRHGAGAVSTLLEAELEAAGCEVSRFSYDPGTVPLVEEFAHDEVRDPTPQSCVIGKVRGRGSGRSLMLFAHPDTEPNGRATGWQSDPFRPVFQAGRMIGWGAADALAGVAMLPSVLADLSGLQGEVTVIAAPSKRHRRGIAAALDRGYSADAALYLHPAESGRGLCDIKAFAPGQLEFTVTISGRPPDTEEPAHTAFAHRAANPFEKAGLVVGALQALDRSRGTAFHHPVLDAAIGRSTNLVITQCEFGSPDRPLQIAERCRLRCAASLIPGERLQDVMDDITEAVTAVAEQDAWLEMPAPAINWLSGVAAAETLQSSAIYCTVDEVLASHGAKAGINPLHTSSDIRNPMVQRNIPTLGFGPLCGNLASNGLTGEWVNATDLQRAVRATADIARRWCGD